MRQLLLKFMLLCICMCYCCVLFAETNSTAESDSSLSVFFFILAFVATLIIVKLCVEKRKQNLIFNDKKNTDFDRSLFIGNNKARIYFDSMKNQAMIVKASIMGIKKEYIDGISCSDASLINYKAPNFVALDLSNRKILVGKILDSLVKCSLLSVNEFLENNKIRLCNSEKLTLSYVDFKKVANADEAFSPCWVIVDENSGMIMTIQNQRVKSCLSYLDDVQLECAKKEKSHVMKKLIGRYLFIIDDLFKKLMIIDDGKIEVFNYSDIIDVTYEENGDTLFSKSGNASLAGAVVGGVLFGAAGAIVGGLGTETKQVKSVISMDVKILLRNKKRTSYVMHFKNSRIPIRANTNAYRRIYQDYLNNAIQAKDILSVIIDGAIQETNDKQPINTIISQNEISIADELAKLVKLSEQGVITREEFESQKTKLLCK